MFEGIVVGVNVTTMLLPVPPLVAVPFSLIVVVVVTRGVGALGVAVAFGAACFLGRPAFLAGVVLDAAPPPAGFFFGLAAAFFCPAVADCFF